MKEVFKIINDKIDFYEQSKKEIRDLANKEGTLFATTVTDQITQLVDNYISVLKDIKITVLEEYKNISDKLDTIESTYKYKR